MNYAESTIAIELDNEVPSFVLVNEQAHFIGYTVNDPCVSFIVAITDKNHCCLAIWRVDTPYFIALRTVRADVLEINVCLYFDVTNSDSSLCYALSGRQHFFVENWKFFRPVTIGNG